MATNETLNPNNNIIAELIGGCKDGLQLEVSPCYHVLNFEGTTDSYIRIANRKGPVIFFIQEFLLRQNIKEGRG